MRVRHLGPFPFQWSGNADTNTADIEPITLSLADAVKLWWRAQKLLFTFSINATYGGDTRTFNNALLFEDFHAKRTRADSTYIEQGDELLLCYPGIDAAWNDVETARFTFSTAQSIANWGVSPIATGFGGSVECRMFTTTVNNALVKRRGTWTDESTVKPAIDISLGFVWYNGVDANAFLTFTNIDYGTTGTTINATLFGQNVTMYQVLTRGGYTGLTINSASLAITGVASFEYDKSTGGEPVYTSGGVQLLDPRTASVP